MFRVHSYSSTMKSAAESNKEGRKSLSASNDEESKRNKFEKAKKQYPKIKGNKDVFCWTCHRSGNIATCSRCPRAYHLKCGHLEKVPEPSEKWICPECDIVQRANGQTSNSQLKVLSQMLGYVIDRMKQVKGSEDFCEPVDTSKWHDYLDYVIKPMDIPKLADNVRRHLYKSTEAFLADFRWLVHDSYVYNSVHSAYTKTAKGMYAVAKQECEEIKNCADCYLHAYSLGENEWFIEPCNTPHVLVWAQLSGFPYWPGKVMRHVSGDLVDVRFFGDHSRANVPVTSCFLYSRLMPCTVKKNHPKIADGIEEAEQHVSRLKSLYSTFYYAQYRIRYVPKDEDIIRKLQLPGFRRPNETPEFLKKVELERADKMILDKDFQSEMKQLYTQKKALVPTKRKSVEQPSKEGAKRRLVQLNTPMGPKCAIVNWSGSESDSSPKHVPERMVENTKPSLLNSSLISQLIHAPTKRIRLSDKLESPTQSTLKKSTEPENDAMVKQVVATSPKELVDIYKSISPNKPLTPVKDTGIIESISRKLLSPTSLRSIRARNDRWKEDSPSQRTIDMAVQKATMSSPVKSRQNGFPKKFRGFSSECQEESDGDSDALVIASREPSPDRNDGVMSSRDENPPTKPDSPDVCLHESGNRVLDTNSPEKVEAKSGFIENQVLDSKNFEEKRGSKNRVLAHAVENRDSCCEKVEEMSESENLVLDSESSAEKVEVRSASDENRLLNVDSSSENVEQSESENTVSVNGSTAEKVETVSESDKNRVLDRDSYNKNVEEKSESKNRVLNHDSPTEKAEAMSAASIKNRILDRDSCSEKVEEMSESHNLVLDSESSTEKVEVKSDSDENRLLNKDSSIEKVDEKSDCENSVLESDPSAEKVEAKSACNENRVFDPHSFNEKIEKKNESSPDMVDDKAISDFIACQENRFAETAPTTNMMDNEDKSDQASPESEIHVINESSVVESEPSNANDSMRSGILDLLNGDLTHLYDNLASEGTDSDDGVINDTISATSKTGQFEESGSELSVVSSSSSTSSALLKRDQRGQDSNSHISKEDRSEPSVLSISSCSSINSNLKEDQIRRDSKTDNNEKSVDSSPDDSRKVETDASTAEVIKTTETVVDPKCSKSLPLEKKLFSSSDKEKSDQPTSQNGEHVADIQLVTSVDSKSTESQQFESSGVASTKPRETAEPLFGAIVEPSKELAKLESPEPDTITKEGNGGILSSPLSEKRHSEPPKENEGSTLLENNKLLESSAESSELAGVNEQKASGSTVLLENTVERVDEASLAKSSTVQRPQTTIIFTSSTTSECVLKKKSPEKEEKLVNQSLHREERGGEIKVDNKSSSAASKVQEDKGVSKRQLPSVESTSKNKSNVIGSLVSNTTLVSDAREPDKNFVTITSSMSLSHLSASTSARTQPVNRTSKSYNNTNLTPAKRKAAEAPSAGVKNQKVKDANKDVASGMPRPIIIKVEPDDGVQEVLESPPPLTSKTAPINAKPSIKVVQISNLMENPPPSARSRNCPTPTHNVPSKRIAARTVEKKSSRLLDASKEDKTPTEVNSGSKDLHEMIPPFSPKRDVSDVRALIEAKKQFISAKLKADIYEMLDEIKADYESHIELLTNVSDRYLQHFENTFETDKIKLYEDFKNKLRDQMDQEITEIKRKQWCANCGAEASYHCCWNHAYCGDKCQKEDWSSHTQVCTQYSMSATDPYIRASPRFQALLEKQNGASRKISLQDLIDLPVAVSVQNSPPKLQIKKSAKKVIGSTPTFSTIPTISIPDSELPELPKPPPSAKSFLTAPVQRLNNGEQISFDNGKHAYRIIQSPGAQKTLKVVGTPQSLRNQSTVNTYSGPLMRLGGQGRSFAVVVGGDGNSRKLTIPSQSYSVVQKNKATPPSTSGNQASRLATKNVTLSKRIAPAPGATHKKSPSVRVMEDTELASILSRNHLRDAYIHTQS